MLEKGDASEESLFDNMQTKIYPFSLPYHRDRAIVRESLFAICKRSLNTIFFRSRQDAFGMDKSDFTYVPIPSERLRLYDGHLELLAKVQESDIEVYVTLFDYAPLLPRQVVTPVNYPRPLNSFGALGSASRSFVILFEMMSM